MNKAQNSTVSAFLYAVSGTSDLLVVPSQYFYLQQNDVLYVQPNKSKANSAVVVPPTTSLIFSATSILLTIANLIITAWSISK